MSVKKREEEMSEGKMLRHSFVVVLAVVGASGANADTLYQPGVAHVNPLLGHWSLSKAEANGATPGAAADCSKEYQFEPNDEKLEVLGSNITIPVANYNVAAKEVFVVGNSGGHVSFELVDENTIVLRDGMANCFYTKG
jgi:hypothetical protein